VAASGSTSAGGYGNHSIQVRAIDSTGQAGAIGSTSASSIAPVVTPYKGPDASAKCGGCNYIGVRVSGIAPGTYSVKPVTSPGSNGYVAYTLRVDGNGNGSAVGTSANGGDWFGFPNGWVQFTVDGITGTANPWANAPSG
jgi:hypothetical protein